MKNCMLSFIGTWVCGEQTGDDTGCTAKIDASSEAIKDHDEKTEADSSIGRKVLSIAANALTISANTNQSCNSKDSLWHTSTEFSDSGDANVRQIVILVKPFSSHAESASSVYADFQVLECADKPGRAANTQNIKMDSLYINFLRKNNLINLFELDRWWSLSSQSV